MGALFKKPPPATPVVDPADVANRKGEARLRRMAGGGSVSTILTDAMAARSAASPRQTLIGMGG